jgi:hypothetical protein
MTPQSLFMLVALLEANRAGALRALLASMNLRPGVADPENRLVPFGRFDRLHFARFVILDDPAADDIAVYGLPRPEFATSLAFLADCDGPADEFVADLVDRAGDGLRKIFAHCQGFAAAEDLLAWMKAHAVRPAASYVNWIGRTVRQIREEAALREALVIYVDRNAAALAGMEPGRIRARMQEFVTAERQAGRLTLTPPDPTPLSWSLRNLLHAVGVPLLSLLLAPALLLYLPLFVVQLRRRERRDPEIVPRPDPAHVRRLADMEDHDVTNQFSAMGTVKPGLFRRWLVTVILWLLDYGIRHIYNRGYLTRVTTIHFAHWTFLEGKRCLLFASNYDGSLESYMDDFINKVAWGLNLAFSNGVGYPRTNWLILGGAKDEQKFKHFLRRHELPTEVWYKAYPGLSSVDLLRNARIRQGLEQSEMTAAEVSQWLSLF